MRSQNDDVVRKVVGVVTLGGRSGRAGLARRMVVAVLGCAAVVVSSVPAVAAVPAPSAAAAPADPAGYVNPMIGTGVGGQNVGSVNLFPGPAAPSGMLQWSPDTAPAGEVDPAGYLYSDSDISGFSLTHLSGAGCKLFRDFEFLPTTKPVTTSPGTGWSPYSGLQSGWAPYIAPISHSQETAEAGYYSVNLQNPAGDIGVQLTAAPRAALGRFTFPPGQPATMLIDTSHSYGDDGGSSFQVVSPNTVVGSDTGGHFCGHPNWPTNPAPLFAVHFAVTFDHPFSSYGTWQGGTAMPGSASVSGKGAGGWVSFDTSSSPVVTAKVAISYVSVDGAEANMSSATSGFSTMQAQTYDAWNRALSKIGVSGGTPAEETTFYTALYHALLDPSVFSDANGQYMGFDSKVHTVPPGHEQYTNFSGWDIYRSEVPLLALLAPGRTSDMMQSLVNDAEQGGWLPKWPTANLYTGMMGGDSADPVIADAHAFGARDFDVKSALAYMLKDASVTSAPIADAWQVPRLSYMQPAAWGDYLNKGYVPSGSDAPFGSALTEEFALDDFAIAQFAAAGRDAPVQAAFMRRAQNWQNVFDPGSGYMQPRGPGALPPPADPATQRKGFEEGDAAQYTWMVPQNFAGLFTALGGKAKAASELDSFFTQLNAGSSAPYDWAGNEVTLDAPWAYDYLGQPWKTQQTVRDIITQLYSPTPGGEPGNDDLGAMSSWYVWAALGMYPETPGTATLALGSPLFPHAVIHLANGKDITINATGAAANAPYVQDLQLDGQQWPKNYLSSGQYSHGATLTYDLAATPDNSRGTGPEASPPSYTAGEASAIGFTSPWGGAVVAAGQSASLRVGAQSEVSRPLTLSWSATAPSGIQVTPSPGTLTLKPDGQATMPASVSVASTVPSGIYPIHFSFTGSGGRQVTSADLELEVP